MMPNYMYVELFFMNFFLDITHYYDPIEIIH